jgi:hypothetical protein
MVTTLKLSDVKTGTPKVPVRWSNTTQSFDPLDPFAVFLKRLEGQSLLLRHIAFPPDASMYHRNFLEYLEKCWGDHLGVVITPDILWFTVLSELVGVVKESPEPYRHLFTTSHEKQEIVIESQVPEVMPLNRLVAALRHHVPTDAGLFMPEFSTTSERARHARYAAFCDLCSPYYDYSMLLCAFPAIQVQGTKDDWELVVEQWSKLRKVFRAADAWMGKVEQTLRDCASNLENAEWWRSMFKLERCGSGHQTEVSGWLSELFRVQPRVAYASNFATHVAQVDYTELASKQEFKMQEGLFFSRQEGDFMVPDFGYSVHKQFGR